MRFRMQMVRSKLWADMRSTVGNAKYKKYSHSEGRQGRASGFRAPAPLYVGIASGRLKALSVSWTMIQQRHHQRLIRR